MLSQQGLLGTINIPTRLTTSKKTLIDNKLTNSNIDLLNSIVKGVRGLLSIQCIKIGDIFFLCILTNFKIFSAPRVLIRFQLCKLHIVNQYNVNKTCLFKKKMVH